MRFSLALLMLAGCPKDSQVGETTEAGTSGRPTSTGEEPTTGDALPRREMCERYIACIGATTPAALPAAQEGFGDSSVCWQGDSTAAQQCVDACESLLEQYREMFPDEPKCGECLGNDECDPMVGEVCAGGECTICGNGVIDPAEICDSQPSCDPTCDGPAECSPLTNVGCEETDTCLFNFSKDGTLRLAAFCFSLDGKPLAADGEVCTGPEDKDCHPGSTCLKAELLADGCAGEGCCTPFCDQMDLGACAQGSICRDHRVFWPNEEFVEEGLDFLGICAIPEG